MAFTAEYFSEAQRAVFDKHSRAVLESILETLILISRLSLAVLAHLSHQKSPFVPVYLVLDLAPPSLSVSGNPVVPPVSLIILSFR